jgi:hypothetical protein
MFHHRFASSLFRWIIRLYTLWSVSCRLLNLLRVWINNKRSHMHHFDAEAGDALLRKNWKWQACAIVGNWQLGLSPVFNFTTRAVHSMGRLSAWWWPSTLWLSCHNNSTLPPSNLKGVLECMIHPRWKSWGGPCGEGMRQCCGVI